MKDGDSYRDVMLYHLRSDKVSEAMNTMSMVPAGGLTFDTSKQDIAFYLGNRRNKASLPKVKDNEAFWYTVIREFEEEVLGRSELECSERFVVPSCYREPFVSVRFLGMGLDPLNIKMEGMLAMDIDLRHVIDGDGKILKKNELMDHILKMTGLKTEDLKDHFKLSFCQVESHFVSVLPTEDEISRCHTVKEQRGVVDSKLPGFLFHVSFPPLLQS